MCIAVVETWCGIANGQISSTFLQLSVPVTSIFSFQGNNLSKSQQIFIQLDVCIDIVILLWIAFGYISSIFDRVISSQSIC